MEDQICFALPGTYFDYLDGRNQQLLTSADENSNLNKLLKLNEATFSKQSNDQSFYHQQTTDQTKRSKSIGSTSSSQSSQEKWNEMDRELNQEISCKASQNYLCDIELVRQDKITQERSQESINCLEIFKEQEQNSKSYLNEELNIVSELETVLDNFKFRFAFLIKSQYNTIQSLKALISAQYDEYKALELLEKQGVIDDGLQKEAIIELINYSVKDEDII